MARHQDLANKGIDWTLLSLYLSLVIVGLLMQYATYYKPGSTDFLSVHPTFVKQLMWTGVALFVFFLCFLIDWKIWNIFVYQLYGIMLLLLIGVLFFGKEINGAKSWFVISGFSFQPSEFAKFTSCLAMAGYLGSFKSDLKEWSNIFIAGAIMIAPAILIMLQPDFGSAIVYASFLLVLYRKGLSSSLYLIFIVLSAIFVLSLKYSPQLVLLISISAIFMYLIWLLVDRLILFVVPLIVLSIAIFFAPINTLIAILGGMSFLLGVGYFLRERQVKTTIELGAILLFSSLISFGSKFIFDQVLEPHQQDRINVWLRPELCNPQGSLYNILQSKIAIGSGGIQGKGFLEGAMTRLNYVPEQSTDFIFSVIGEEQGFIGVAGVIILFVMLIIRITVIAERARNEFMNTYAYCVAGFIFLHFFLNVGMTMGIMPVIGIPLPFISKGGSALIAFSAMLGVLLKMDMTRYIR